PANWRAPMQFIGAYHSFYPLHAPAIGQSPYDWMMNAQERKLLPALQAFQPNDLYRQEDGDIHKVLDEHLARAMEGPDQYFPDPIPFPVLTDGLPRLLRLESASTVQGVVDVLADDVRFENGGAVILRSDRLLNGWMAAQYEKYLIAKKANDDAMASSLLRM